MWNKLLQQVKELCRKEKERKERKNIKKKSKHIKRNRERKTDRTCNRENTKKETNVQKMEKAIGSKQKNT